MYASFNSNKLLKNILLKAGVHHLGENCQSDNRIRVNFQETGTDYHWYHRTVIQKDKYRFGFLGVYDLGRKVLQKNNILFAYNHSKKHSAYLRAENDSYRKNNPNLNDPASFFDKIIVDYVNNLDEKSKAALEATYSLKDKNLASVQAVYERQEGKRTFKVGVDNNLDVKAFVKAPLHKFEGLAKLTSGVGVSGIMKN